MTDRTVGFGKTFATIQAALNAAAASGDTVIVSDKTALGSKYYEEDLVVLKDVIIRSDNILRKWILGGSISLESSCTIRDFILYRSNKALEGNVAGITVTAERGWIVHPSFAGVITSVGGGMVITCNNVIVWGGDRVFTNGFHNAAAGSTLNSNFCSVFAAAGGWFNQFGTMTDKNCIAFDCGADYFGTIGGDSNATNEAAGAPGTNPVHNLTLADMALARDESPSGGTQFPIDFRSVEAALTANASAIQDAGNPVSGVTDDIDGRTRDVSTPNIGPSEGFPGFGAASAPTRPTITLGAISGLNIPVTMDGDAGIINNAELIRRTTGALVDAQQRTDDGVINLTANVRPAAYDVLAWSGTGPFSRPTLLAGGAFVPATQVGKPFAAGSVDTFKSSALGGFIDFAKLAEFTVITDGRERMRLHEPFENRIIPLDHVKPSGTVSFVQSDVLTVSPTIGLAAGEYFYGFTVISRSQHVEIESTALRTGRLTVASISPFVRQQVAIDASLITRIWSEATHVGVYRSKKVTQSGDTDPFPTYARVGLIPIADLSVSPFVAFVDDTPDEDLDFTNNALNPFTGTPPIAPYIAEYKNRIFATGFEPIQGTDAQVTNGSPNVEMPPNIVDILYVGSSISFGTGERAYVINDVVRSADRVPSLSPAMDLLVLGDEKDATFNYAGTTGTKNFFICFDPTEVRFTEPGKPWAWPAANSFRVGQGHGRNTMIGASRNTLIVGKRTEIWGYIFNQFPTRGTDYQLSGKIGAVSQRTFSLDENGKARWLAPQGVAEYNGAQVGIISEGIAEKFRDIVFDSTRGNLALRAVAAHDIERHQYICGIPTALADKNVGVREFVVYHYNTRAWSIFKTQVEVTAMEQDRDEAGYPAVLVGTRLGHVGTFGIGATDFVGLPGNTGDVKGFVDSYEASPDARFLDSSASHFREVTSPKLGVIGAAVEFFAGTGAGQISRIINQEVSPPFLFLEDKLTVKPDSTTQYRIGAISCDHRSPWIDFGSNRTKYLESFEVAYYIESLSPQGVWTLEILVDQAGVAAPTIAQSGRDRLGVTTPIRFTFKTTGSDEPVPRGKAARDAIGLRRFNVGNLPFIRFAYRLFSDDPAAPGTIINVTPILRPDEEPSP